MWQRGKHGGRQRRGRQVEQGCGGHVREHREHPGRTDGASPARRPRIAPIARVAAGAATGLLVLATGCGDNASPGSTSSPSATAGTGPASPTSPTSSALGRCSAAGLSADVPKQTLPEPVASTRSQIAKAAVACDYDALDRIAQSSPEGFSFSFGGQKGKPGDYWRRLETEGKAPLAFMVKALSVSNAVTVLPATLPSPGTSPNPNLTESKTIYVWPAAATKDVPTEEDWAEVEGIYPKEVAKMKEDTAKFGIGYLGWRAGITAPGNWIYFIEGD